MLPKRKKNRSFDKKLRSALKTQNRNFQRAVHSPPDNGQMANLPTSTDDERKYYAVVFNVNSEGIEH